MTTGLVFNIQKYSLHDGPGIRSTVFLKGCPLCCAWCHNPESICPRREFIVVETRCLTCGECREACPFGATAPGVGPLPTHNEQCTFCAACVDACPTGSRQMVGGKMTVPEVLTEVMKDRLFYEDSGGGVTVSGGEPLMQTQFVKELFTALRDREIHVALDTTGFGCTDHLLDVAKLAHLVLYDLKAFSDARHREITGVSNRSILENLKALDAVHQNLWIRIPIVPGYTDDLAELKAMAGFVAGLRNVKQVNLLPFHGAAQQKYERLGLVNAVAGVCEPKPDFLEQVAKVFRALPVAVKVGG